MARAKAGVIALFLVSILLFAAGIWLMTKAGGFSGGLIGAAIMTFAMAVSLATRARPSA